MPTSPTPELDSPPSLPSKNRNLLVALVSGFGLALILGAVYLLLASNAAPSPVPQPLPPIDQSPSPTETQTEGENKMGQNSIIPRGMNENGPWNQNLYVAQSNDGTMVRILQIPSFLKKPQA